MLSSLTIQYIIILTQNSNCSVFRLFIASAKQAQRVMQLSVEISSFIIIILRAMSGVKGHRVCHV